MLILIIYELAGEARGFLAISFEHVTGILKDTPHSKFLSIETNKNYERAALQGGLLTTSKHYYETTLQATTILIEGSPTPP